jgi:nucleoside-diphosphate-sugar epimerase
VIAVLGGTGYIGRSIGRLLADEGRPICLFARDLDKLAGFGWPQAVQLRDLAEFSAAHFDLVINTIGVGDPARVKSVGAAILDITDYWDRRVMETMAQQTKYVFLSSGAVYGSDFDKAVQTTSTISLPVNALNLVAPYTLAKISAEIRHRLAMPRPIVDVRVFGYADPALDLGGEFFLANLARAICDRAPIVTTRENMIRDYAGARELWALIENWLASSAPNCALDLYTKAPTSKLALLQQSIERYDLRVEYAAAASNPTGEKHVYASEHRAAAVFGYQPARNSAQVVTEAIDAILAGR